MISGLIYYSETHDFFDRHYDEIEDIRRNFERDHGYPFHPSGDLKNDLVWFAYEHVAYLLASDLGIWDEF